MSTVGPLPRGVLEAIDADVLAALGDGVHTEFRAQAQRMPPLTRRLLLRGEASSSIDPEALLEELALPAEVSAAARRGLASSKTVLTRRGELPSNNCAALRAAVDAEHQEKCDSVDGAPDHQLNVSRDGLEALVGADAVAALWRLPAEFAASQGDAPMAAALEDADAQIFIRRYAPEGRPWNPFHTDSALVTVNVALSDDAQCDGGRLLCCSDGAIRDLARTEGEATVHASTLLHGVSQLRRGVRYSLIIFFGRAANLVPRELLFDDAARRAEAAALAALLAEACLLRCSEATNEGAMQPAQRLPSMLLRSGLSGLVQRCADDDAALQTLGRLVETVVQRYGAPHLRPVGLLAKATEVQGGADDASWAWAMRSLVVYSTEVAAEPEFTI